MSVEAAVNPIRTSERSAPHRSSIARQVTVLMSGTAAAQLLTAFVSPLLARMYTPSDFGIFGLFSAVVGFISVAACASYELNIVLPKRNRKAWALFALSCIVSCLVAALTAVAVTFAAHPLSNSLDTPALAPLLWWAPLFVLGAGIHQAATYWCTRRRLFSNVSASLIARSLWTVALQLAGGIVRMGSFALVIATVSGQSIAALFLTSRVHRHRSSTETLRSIRRDLLTVARRYADSATYRTTQRLLNGASQLLAPFLLAAFFGPTVSGLYWFAQRLLQMPAMVVTQSVRQVFFKRAADLHNTKGNVHGATIRATSWLIGVGIIPTALVFVAGPTLFSFVFGAKWHESGVYARWLCLWWFSALVNSASVMLVPLYALDRWYMLFELITMLVRVAGILLGAWFGSALVAIQLSSIAGLAFNVWLMITVSNVARQRSGRSS